MKTKKLKARNPCAVWLLRKQLGQRKCGIQKTQITLSTFLDGRKNGHAFNFGCQENKGTKLESLLFHIFSLIFLLKGKLYRKYPDEDEDEVQEGNGGLSRRDPVEGGGYAIEDIAEKLQFQCISLYKRDITKRGKLTLILCVQFSETRKRLMHRN